MKRVQLVHNPSAGDEAHSKENLLAQIARAGFECRYSSTKEESWKEEVLEDVDLIAVAGGDGTVRKVVKQLLKNKFSKQHVPLAVLPMGTANNVARSINSMQEVDVLVQSWKDATPQKIDIGEVENVAEESFFLEGMGFGVFPLLMKEMKDNEVVYDSPEDELNGALKRLHKIVMDFNPRRCKLDIDGTDHSGNFYMVEVMNIRSIGPNLELAPLANLSDGEFEVVLVPESHREQFTDYLLHKLTGEELVYQFPTLKGRNIKICWDGTHLHVDDRLLKQDKETDVKITLKEGALQFLVPGNESTNR